MTPSKYSIDWYKTEIFLIDFMITYDTEKRLRFSSRTTPSDPVLVLMQKDGTPIERYAFYIETNTKMNKYFIINDSAELNGGHTVIDFVLDYEKKIKGKEINFRHALYNIKKIIDSPNYKEVSTNFKIPKKLPRAEAKEKFDYIFKNYVTPLKTCPYLENRSIYSDTYNHPLFIGTVLNHSYKDPQTEKQYNNVCYPIYKISGPMASLKTLVAFTTKNKDESFPERGFKQVRGEKSAGLVISNFKDPKAIKNLHVFESWDDALSYFQLNKDNINPEQSLFCSIEGTAGAEQWTTLKNLCLHLPIENIHIPFDNDLKGNLNKLFFLQQVIVYPYTIEIDPNKQDVQLNIKVSSSSIKELEELSSVIVNEFSKLNLVNIADDNTENTYKINYTTSTNNRITVQDMQVTFPKNSENILDVAQILTTLVNISDQLKIDLSSSNFKDYTADLEFKEMIRKSKSNRLT